MWRAATVVACVAVLLALPAASSADVPGYTPIGPPETLNAIVFANDGTIYGTVNRITGFTTPTERAAALWRSTDHGRSWKSVYRPPSGTQLAVLGVAPRDASSVVLEEASSRRDGAIERLDVATGRVVPLPLDGLLGVDAAGNAYGLLHRGTTAHLGRCRLQADACDDFGVLTGRVSVDPNSTGLLARIDYTGIPPTPIDISTDGGATWTRRAAPVDAAWLAFAGPAAGTLYALTGSTLAVSHDLGVTFSAARTFSQNGGLIVGSGPSATVSSGGLPVLASSDEGVTFRSIAMPIPGGPLAVDPADPDHFFIHSTDETRQTWDGGASWSAVQDSRFGMVIVDPATASGSGTSVYSIDYGHGSDPHAIWSTHDLGATWSRTPMPAGARSRPLVDRDDPATAYVRTDSYVPAAGGTVVGALRTHDGGMTWAPLAFPAYITGEQAAITWIDPARPAHVFSEFAYGTADDGATWTPTPVASQCYVRALADPASPTGQRLTCAAGAGQPVPVLGDSIFTPGIVDDPPSGLRAIASADLLGDVTPDLTWTSALLPSGAFGPQAPGVALGAWPVAGGSTFYAATMSSIGAPRFPTWVRRGTGRWWRVQAGGADLRLIAVLDATHALVSQPLQDDQMPLAVLDLSHPALAPPDLRTHGGVASCTVPWTAADAETSAYAWVLDGVVVPGASVAQYTPGDADRGHDLACRATARTDFGSTTVTSAAFTVARTAVAARRRLALTGTARIGRTLRCGAAAPVTWFRDGRAIRGRHARSFTTRRGDRGHTLACQTRTAGGSLVRSRAVRIRA